MLDFIPVELLRPIVMNAQSLPADPVETIAPTSLPQVATEAEESWAERTSLFGETEA